jgi:hypothetical protein
MPSAEGDLKHSAHPHRGCEARLDRPHDLETNLLVKTLSRANSHLEAIRATVPSPLARILHEQSTDSASHLIRLHEQTIELVDASPTRDDHREADRRVIAQDRDPRPTILDERLWELDRIRVGSELLAILLPDVRRPALQRLERCTLVPSGVADAHPIRHYKRRPERQASCRTLGK